MEYRMQLIHELAANRTWFDFRVDREISGAGDLSVYAFSGTETVSLPYEFEIELVSRNSNLDLTRFLGAEALLTIEDRSGKKRLAHGVIRRMDQLHTANAFTHYRCELVPRLWFLSRTQDHRIYQHQSVTQIIDDILRRHRFYTENYAFKLREEYPKRPYCVQYGESDLHFLSRICEEEGIYFYFEHTENSHCLCFSDAEGGPSIPGEHLLRFYPGSGNPADTAVVSRLSLRHRINSDAATYREWNFTTPSVDLTGQDKESEWDKAPTPMSMQLETYQFPHLYQTRDEGSRYTGIQLRRQLTYRQWIDCESDVSRHTPGFTFILHEHPRSDVNRGWWIVSVEHAGKQPTVLEHESPDGRGLEYKAKVTAIPDDVRFVPKLQHKKVRVDGLQSAIVTGPAGEEVYCDEYGRVKVQFHWDRLGNHDEKTTCWVRVADSWAGMNFGFIQAPRIGQEVMVEFMEGDPDRPVITGRVYNAHLMPPWKLPSQKTLSGIQSREFKAGRRNQLVLDDTQDQIQTQLSSDHGLSQLNLGYITRVNHIEGRKDFRGEGFELRTDNWGSVRAAKGMYIGTDTRSGAERHHKDISEAVGNIQGAVNQHEETAKLAEVHKAQDHEADVSVTSRSLHHQSDQIRGSGKPHEELAAPHLLLSSPAGIALTTPASTHAHTDENTAVSAGRHVSISAGRSFLVSALDKVSLFAHKLGMRLFAARGKVEIQAQSDGMDIIAEKVLQIISAQESVRIFSPKEILLTAGGSYVSIGENGIEEGTPGNWKVYAADRQMGGPKSAGQPDCPLPSGLINDEQFVALDMDGKPFPSMPFKIVDGDDESQVLAEGMTDKSGRTPRLYSVVDKKLKVIWDIERFLRNE
jgi:type VI secretion system secreted protein VgrG